MTDVLLIAFSVLVLGWVIVNWWRGGKAGRGPFGPPGDGGSSDGGGGGGP